MMTSSSAVSSTPLETRLLLSLVFRVITICSGVVWRYSARIFRVLTLPTPILARFWKDTSPSMSFVLLYMASSTGTDDGHRLAAFMTLTSIGITNCSRTDRQNDSSGDAGVCGSGAGRSKANPGRPSKAAEPPAASKRVKLRRLMPPSLRACAVMVVLLQMWG